MRIALRPVRDVMATVAALGRLRTGRRLAQSYPTKPIHIMVGFAPGGPADVMARLIAQRLPALLGQSVIVENKPGAGGTIAAKLVSESDPDGYTLLLGNTSTLVISPLVYRNVGYDPAKGFAPVALLGTTSNLLVVNPSVRGEIGPGADRAGQGQSGQAQLFVARHRHAAASDRRAVQAARRRRHRARALQGRRRSPARP